MGSKNAYGQIYTIRNAFFEPTLSPNIDNVEDCLYTAFATYIEIITHTNTTTNNLEKYITEAIEMYGPTLLEDLIEFPPLEKNEELRLFLKQLHKYFEDNEELY
jgi:hypothetical protein